MTTDEIRDAIEHDHAIEIDHAREQARRHLGHLVNALGPLRAAAQRLCSEALFDVDVIDTAAVQVIPAAVLQIEVAAAALDAAIPHPGQ